MISIALIGILVAILLPAVMCARESARRTHCVNNLRGIGVAVEQYHSATKQLPQAWAQVPDGVSGYGWAVALLPYFEKKAISERIVSKLPIMALQNEGARNSDMPLLRCASDISEPAFELYPEDEHSEHQAAAAKSGDEMLVSLARLPTANYAGVYGTLEADDGFPAPPGDGPIVSGRRVRFQDLERGISHTILVGERTTAMVPTTWYGVDFRGEDAACRLVGSAITSPNCEPCDECEFGSRHSGGANFVWGDGHVTLVTNEIDSLEYQRMSQRREH
jgi:prepilin-type processing-associated H-X9-DG protein